MEFAFYFASGIAVVSTLRVITHTNPVHALLYLIISLIAVAMTFFALGAPFAGVLEVIAYAGAIMVLFVFVVMMLNLGPASVQQERVWLKPGIWLGPVILGTLLLVELLYVLFSHQSGQAIGRVIEQGKAGLERAVHQRGMQDRIGRCCIGGPLQPRQDLVRTAPYFRQRAEGRTIVEAQGGIAVIQRGR